MGKGAGQCDREPLRLAPLETMGGQRDAAKRWTEDRIQAELAPFLEGRDDWPTQAEFKAAGLRTLMTCGVYKTGGPVRWTRRFGATPPKSPVRAGPVMAATAARLLTAVADGRRPFDGLPSKNIPVSAAAMQVLLVVRSHPHATLNAIGAPLAMTRVAVAPLLEALVEQGLITETVNPDQRRRRIRRLTEQGEVLVRRFLLARLKAEITDSENGPVDRQADQHFPLVFHPDAA